MARKLATSTLARLGRKLEEERVRLEGILDEFERQREKGRLAETASEHNADPNNADGGSLAFEMEMDFSVQHNARQLLKKVVRAEERIAAGTYGICEVSGEPIPLTRLEALPYTPVTIEYADRV